jgi:hypothetical protein
MNSKINSHLPIQQQDYRIDEGTFTEQRKFVETLTNTIKVGTVQHSLPYEGSYLVRLINPSMLHTCTGGSGNGSAISVKESGVYAPNTTVICWWNGDPASPGVILGAIPDSASSPYCKSVYGTNIHLFGRMGVRKDLVSQKFSTEKDTPYFGDGGAVDVSSLGDFCRSNVMGGLIYMGLLQSIIRVADDCGIWLNHIDGLMRIVARTQQLWTPASAYERLNYANEAFDYKGYVVNTWEMLGRLQKPGGVDDWIKTDPSMLTDTESPEHVIGLQESDSGPFYRAEEFHGWLGQGGMRSFKSLPGGATYKPAEPVKTRQLLRETVTNTGNYIMQAAGMLMFSSKLNMPCFQQIKRYGDKENDLLDDGYAAKRDGEWKEAVEQLEPSGEVHESIEQQLNANEALTQAEYKITQPFELHEKDYKRVDYQDSVPPVQVEKLKTEQLLPPQKTAEVQIDSEVKVRRTIREAKFGLTEDGGFLIEDAFGNVVRTGAQGCVKLSGELFYIFQQ